MAWEYHKVEIAWASQPDAATPLWTDVTRYVDPAVDIVITRGRPTELDEVAPSTLTLALNNADHRFTPGNPYSPYYPNVKPARRIRVSETIEGITYYLFTGYLQFPDIDDWAQADATHPFDQVITVSAVDRIARLDRARSFISTLGELIRTAVGTELQVWYPLNEPEKRWLDRAGTREPMVPGFAFINGSTEEHPLVLPGEGIGPAGDDIACVDMQPVINGSGGVDFYAYLTTTWATPITVSSSTFTVAWWMTWDAATTTSEFAGSIGSTGVAGNKLTIQMFWNSGGFWQVLADVNDGSSHTAFFNVTGGPVADVPALVSIRVTLPSGLVEVWVNDQTPTTATLSGTPPSSASASTLSFGDLMDGSFAHGQVYVGSSYTRTVHLAQYAMGMSGLYRQRSDERITTVAGYAGVAAADLQLDVASAVMPKATLAGEKPGAELRVAAGADSGLLFTAGDGDIVFHARTRRYNAPIVAYIDKLWLAPPWQQRVLPPVNIAEVTRSPDGLTAVSRNSTSADEYGEYASPPATIETATDADPENLARFLTYLYPDPRMRTVVMTFDLMTKSNTVRHTVLAREISDRTSMTGLPTNAPEGIGEQFVEGITHRISTLRRVTEWNMSPVLGPVPGVAAVWAQVDVSVVGDSTVIAY